MHVSNEILISVVIPIYNAEATLRKCMNSLVTQSFINAEFICVDDGSVDTSLQIMQEYQQIDRRFRVFSKPNGGVSSARNFGLEQACGKYVMFLDADDWYEPDACAKAYQLITSEDADVGLFCMMMEYAAKTVPRLIMGSERKTFLGSDCRDLYRRCLGMIGSELSECLKFDNLSLVYLKIYRRNIIVNNDIHFVDIREIGSFEDGLFNLDYLSVATSAVYSPEMLYHYSKVNQNSITTKFRPDLPGKWERLFALLQTRIASELDPSLDHALHNRIAYSIFGLGLNVISGTQGAFEKHRKIKELLRSPTLHRAFSKEDLRHLPFVFRLFFLLAKWKFALGVHAMLWLMSFIRNRNKGF